MFAIYKKELRSYFHSFIGFLFMGITLFFVGLYYTVYNIIYGYPYFTYSLDAILFIFMISVPILTMKILAEEKKQKTDQLILTAPVTVGKVVMGKFLALSTIFVLPLLIIGIYPLILTPFGSVPLGEAYLGLLAFFLYGETCIAIGLLVSSLTESQVIAAVLTFLFLFLGYMMSSICSLISSTGNLITNILGLYDLYTPFYYLTLGTLNLESIAYYISVTALMLFLTVQSIQKRRYSISVKKMQTGAYSVGMIVLAVAVTVVFNLLVAQIPEGIKNVDLTTSKLYTLTDDTKTFLQNMDKDVTIYVFVNEENEDTTMGQTLDRIAEYGEHITIKYVDPAVNPNFAVQFTQSSVSSNSLIFVCGDRSTVVDSDYFYETSLNYETYSYETTGYDGEGQIVSALDYVTSDEISKVYFTTGHGEMSLGSTFTAALEKANITTEIITLLDMESVPEDASCLLITAPLTDFSTADVEKVKAYMETGKPVIAIYGYTDEDMTNFDSLLSYMGLRVTEGLVVENNTNNYYFQSQYFLFPNLANNDFTDGIYQNYYIYAPFSQGIVIEDETSENMTYTDIIYTSDESFARLGYNATGTLTKQEGDEEGPFHIGICAEKTISDETTASMVLFSCEQMFTDSVSQAVSGANLKLFTNTVSNYISEYKSSVSIPVKSYEVSYLTLTSSNVIVIGLGVTVILPLSCLIAGFVIWFKRRKR